MALQEDGSDVAKRALDAFGHMSPISLKMTARQITSIRHFHPGPADPRIPSARQVLLRHDFYEGIRAALVDKDRTHNGNRRRWRRSRLPSSTNISNAGDQNSSLTDTQLPTENSMAYENIIVETRGNVGPITLNRPEALNALSSPLMADLIEALDTRGGRQYRRHGTDR